MTSPVVFRLSPAVEAALRASPVRVVVTGGRGWIGRACLELIDRALGDAIVDRVAVFGSSAGTVALSSGRVLTTAPLAELDRIGDEPTLLAHFAFLTREKADDRPLAAFVAANAEISARVEAVMRRSRPIGLTMPSSGAAKRAGAGPEVEPYGWMKRADEHRFAALCDELGVRFSCPRLFNLSGPHINKLGGYVLASVIRDVHCGRPIGLRADKPVIRSYVHVRDLIDVCFADLLLGGGDGPAVFETAGEVEIEVGDLARRIADLLGRPDLPVERPPLDPSKTADRYVGEPADWRHRLERHGIVPIGLDDQILDTAAHLAARAALGDL